MTYGKPPKAEANVETRESVKIFGTDMIRKCHTQGSYIEWGELDGVFPVQKNMINL